MSDKWENSMNQDGFMALRHMMELQHELQLKLGNDIKKMTPNMKMDYIRTQILACEDELHEALQETGWKPWANNPHINIEAFRAELIDTFQFLMNLMSVAEMTPEMLVWGHAAKVKKNLERNAAKYDGVSTKCPTCRRAYDDDAVKCRPLEGSYDPWCALTNRTTPTLQIGTSRS